MSRRHAPGPRRGGWLRHLLPVVLATLLLVGATAGVSRAAWGDQQTLTGAASTSYTMPAAPVLSCTETLLSARVEWTPQIEPVALGYSATIDGKAANIETLPDGRRRVTVLLDGFISTRTKVVAVNAVLGTHWTGPVATKSVEGTVVVVPLTIACS